MVCIVGVNILDNKYLVILFIYIFGIGCICVCVICEQIGIELIVKVCDFFGDQLDVICVEVVKVFMEGDLCWEINMNIKCLMDLGCYCGICYCCGLLLCGQCIKINVWICKGLWKLICK